LSQRAVIVVPKRSLLAGELSCFALQELAATRLQKEQLEQQRHQLLFQKKVSLLKAAKPGLPSAGEENTALLRMSAIHLSH
jgi:hypothetical protein